MDSIQVAAKIMSETDRSFGEVLGMLGKMEMASTTNAEPAAKDIEFVKRVVASKEEIRSTTNDVAGRIRDLDGHFQEIGRPYLSGDEFVQYCQMLTMC